MTELLWDWLMLCIATFTFTTGLLLTFKKTIEFIYQDKRYRASGLELVTPYIWFIISVVFGTIYITNLL